MQRSVRLSDVASETFLDAKKRVLTGGKVNLSFFLWREHNTQVNDQSKLVPVDKQGSFLAAFKRGSGFGKPVWGKRTEDEAGIA